MENISQKKIKMQRKIENHKSPPPKKIYKNTLKKTAETTICKHETKHTPNKIHNNRLKTSKIQNLNYTQQNTIAERKMIPRKQFDRFEKI